MSPAVLGRARPRRRGASDAAAPWTINREEVCVKRATIGPARLVAFLASRPAPDGYIESWEPGESATSPASLEFYRDCRQVSSSEAQAWLDAQASGIPQAPELDFAPGEFKALAAVGRNRWKDIWGLGYDDDEGLDGILRGGA